MMSYSFVGQQWTTIVYQLSKDSLCVFLGNTFYKKEKRRSTKDVWNDYTVKVIESE